MPIRTKIIIRAAGLGLVLAFIVVLLPGCGGKGVLLVEVPVSAAQGGSIGTSDGKITLEIPPGALTEDTTISIRVLSEDEWTDDIKDLNPVGPVYSLEPDGLTFQEPVTVKLTLDSSLYSLGPDGIEATAPLLYTTDGNSQPEILQAMETVVGPEEAYVQGNTTHFSEILVGRGTVRIEMKPGEYEFQECELFFDATFTVANIGERTLVLLHDDPPPAILRLEKGQKPVNLTNLNFDPRAYPNVTAENASYQFDLASGDYQDLTFTYYITNGKGTYGAAVFYDAAPVGKPNFKMSFAFSVSGDVTSVCGEAERTPALPPMPPPTPTPKVTSTYPANNAATVSVMDGIWIEFDTPMDPKSTEEVLSLNPPKTFETSWANGNTLLTLTLREDLEYDTVYTLVLGTEAMSALGGHPEEAYEFFFTTEEEPDTKPPLITSIIPESGETSIAIDAPIAVTFSEPMDKDSVESAFSIYPSVEGKLVWSDNTMTFYPAVDLDYGASYAIIIDAGAKDLAGNSLEQSYSWEFTTKEAPE